MPIAVALISYTAEIIGTMRRNAGLVVRKTAFDIQAGAQENSRVDTGAQKNSVYVVTSDSSTYAEAMQDASEAYARKHGGQPFPALPEVERPDDALEALVVVGAAYGAVNEYMREPWLGPAAEAQRASFEAAMEHILGNA